MDGMMMAKVNFGGMVVSPSAPLPMSFTQSFSPAPTTETSL